MDKLSKFYPFLINLALVFLLNLGGAVVATDLISLFLYSPLKVAAKTPTRLRKKKSRGPKIARGDIRAILRRNLFCSTCDPISLDNLLKGKSAEQEKKLNSLEGAELLTTMVADKKEHSLAFVKVSEPEEQVLRIALDDMVGTAKVTAIEEKRVTFIKGTQEMELTLLGETTKTVEKPKTKTKPERKKSALERIKDKIKKVGPNKYEIEKSVVQDLMKNMANAGRGARIMPDPKGGFRASFVRTYSLFYKLGVRSGDVIKSVNNIPLNSIQETLMLYTKLKNASHLTMSLNRRGKTVNMDYTIR